MRIDVHPFILGLVLALLGAAALDVGVRVFETRLSGDIANTKRFPEEVAELARSSGKRVAVLGNSLIGDGFASDVFMGNWLARNPGTGKAIKLVPDGSGIWDWHCVVHYQLLDEEAAPNLVIIGYGWDQLSDQNALSLTRAFNSLCPAGAMRDFSALSGRVGINDWLEMGAVKTSKLYAHREPIRHRVLQHLVPEYRRMTRQVNARAGEGAQGEAAVSARRSYAALQRILESLSSNGTQVVLVAMPVLNPYEIDRDMCNLLEGTKHHFLDMRYAVPSSKELYRDGIHLNEAGAQLFSETLATQLRAPRPSMSPCMT